jgi:hypothetical protein
VATPALPNIKASRFRGDGLSRTGKIVGVLDSGVWAALGSAYLANLGKYPARIHGVLALAVGGGLLFLVLAARDWPPVRQHAAAFRLGRMSMMLERAAVRSRPSRRPGRTPAGPEPSGPTPRTGAASAETSTR